MFMVRMSRWLFHSDSIEDTFVLKVQKRPGAGLCGLVLMQTQTERDWYTQQDQLISLYPMNCSLQSEHITWETVPFPVIARMHERVKLWVPVALNLVWPRSWIAFSCIGTSWLYLLITTKTEKRNSHVLNVCRRHMDVCSGVMQSFSAVCLYWSPSANGWRCCMFEHSTCSSPLPWMRQLSPCSAVSVLDPSGLFLYSGRNIFNSSWSVFISSTWSQSASWTCIFIFPSKQAVWSYKH